MAEQATTSAGSQKARLRLMKFSTQELEILVTEVVNNYDVLLGPLSTKTPLSSKQAIWEAMLSRINALGVCQRTVEILKKRWADFKRKTKEKLAKYGISKEQLSPLESLVESTLQPEHLQDTSRIQNVPVVEDTVALASVRVESAHTAQEVLDIKEEASEIEEFPVNSTEHGSDQDQGSFEFQFVHIKTEEPDINSVSVEVEDSLTMDPVQQSQPCPYCQYSFTTAHYLEKHLQKRHTVEYMEIVGAQSSSHINPLLHHGQQPAFCPRNHPDVSTDKPDGDRPRSSSSHALLSSISTATAKKYSSTHPRQLRATNALADYIADTITPLSHVDHPSFRIFVEALDPSYNVPCSKTLSRVCLPAKHGSVHSHLVTLLRSAPSVCVTVDVWSSRQMKSFLGITGHFILDWKLYDVLLASKRFKGHHTGDNIGVVFEETINQFGIKGKITNVITDNASKMKKAFRLPGFEEVGRCDSDTDNGDEDTVLERVNVVESLDVLPHREGCFAHVTQHVVSDGLSKCQASRKALAKAGSLVSHTHKSTIAADILDGERKLQPATAVRWNSDLKMVRSILRADQDKLKQINAPVQLTPADIQCLDELVAILEPFEDATLLTQGSNIVSASYVIPSIIGLRTFLSNFNAKYSAQLVSALKASLEKRLSPYEQMPLYKLAALLDPRFKAAWCPEQLLTATALLQQECARFAPQSFQPANAQDPPPKRSKLFSFMSAPILSAAASTEVTDYLSAPCLPEGSDPLAFWKSHEPQFPALAKLAARYLNVPATSAAVERVFSIAGRTFRPDRCSMSDSRFETLMFIKCNRHVQ
ncbi:UNVERIFIED_CONTAM: hypothetical protein FKN15_048756 [Acipenser sinensis]